MTLFSHLLYFVCLLPVSAVNIYITLFLTKPLFQNKKFFLETFFSQFVLCLTANNSTSRNIGGADAWAAPHLKFFWEDLLSLRP